jgi:hypothetical protein
MSKLSDLGKGLKHLVVEDDGASTPAPVAHIPAPVAHPAFNLPTPMTSFSTGGGAAVAPAGSPFEIGTTPVLDEKTYKTVLGKTDFNNTPVGRIVHKYYDALEGVIPDTTQRFKAAIGQAQKIDNVTPDQILSTFDQMQAALDKDTQDFTTLVAAHDKNEITTRQTSITTKQQQVAQLNQEIAQLTAELASETARSSNATTQHGLAQQRRAQEIAQQKALFTSLLQ